jgi:hypothetical protein
VDTLATQVGEIPAGHAEIVVNHAHDVLDALVEAETRVRRARTMPPAHPVEHLSDDVVGTEQRKRAIAHLLKLPQHEVASRVSC